MHCHLLIPDFFSDEETRPGTRAAAAETLIARGRRKRSAAVSRETWLFERFAVQKQRDWPVAPYTLLADGGAPERHFWMRADPVHLRVSHDGLILAGDSAFDVSHEEAAALIATLNRHFGEDMVFQAIEPTRWHVRLPQAPDMQTTPPSHARGAPIAGQLPSGRDALLFQARMNETQMLFQEHPVNAAREARGEPVLNSIWFWGGGTMASSGIRPFSAVFGNDPLARGLALGSGAQARPLPGHAGAFLTATGSEGVVLAALDPPRSTTEFAMLERDWFEPLLAALRSGRIGMLTLSLPGADSLFEIETVRSDLRYFWRLRKPLAAYCTN
jgi:hypothetical protein